MPKPDFTLKIIRDAGELQRLSARLVALPAFALDIETTEWWNRRRERIALIQIAYRLNNDDSGSTGGGGIKVVIIDPLANLDMEVLRPPLADSAAVKIIHNAAFDAARLAAHYDFRLAPVFDTMLAARRSGERKYSLKAQAASHLDLQLDKRAQTSDWSRRPLDTRQLYYAALDPLAALLLYENQRQRGLSGAYRLRPPADSRQNPLPLGDLPASPDSSNEGVPSKMENSSVRSDLSEEAVALLGVITELPTRYSPAGLAASVGIEARVGLAGWIIDRRLGTAAEPDEESVKMAIDRLCRENLVRITDTRRLEATTDGARLWRTLK